MTKMDKVWVAVATLLSPRTSSDASVTRSQIESKVRELFGDHIPPVMIEGHLVNSEDRHADQKNPRRGGSRNRYLVRSGDGRFRLYKTSDYRTDAWEKTGPTKPNKDKVDPEYRHLLDWHEKEYANAQD